MKINVFPEPKSVDFYKKESASFPLCIETDVAEFKDAVRLFATCFEKIRRVSLKQEKGGILLLMDPTVKSDGYRIDVRDAICISASCREGIRYGLATALQLLSCKDGRLVAPSLLINDSPDKDYRALMIDLARRFHPAKTIFQYIDLCFLYKIKYLHLHFIDDQLYTLPSKEFPLLPTKGQSYTFEEIQSFNDYAKQRGVIIIPEFESPGHAESLTRAYPELFSNSYDTQGTALVTENGDTISQNSIICVGSEASMNAMTRMVREICEMFPDSPYIHIGGDEADIEAWNACSVCRAYMKDHGIEDVHELYSDFIARVSRTVLDLGRTPIVWEGFPVKGAERIPKETVVIAWESHYHQPYDLLEEGFRVINASWQPLYVVASLVRRWYAKDVLEWNVYNWQHWWEGSEATFNPIHVTPTENVLGAQICAWGCTFEQEIGLVMENLAALSERTWNVKRRSGLQEMLEKMEALLKLAAKLIA